MATDDQKSTDSGSTQTPPPAAPAPAAPAPKPMTIGKYLDTAFPDMDKIQRGVFEIKYKTEFHTSSEWDGLVKPDLTRRIV